MRIINPPTPPPAMTWRSFLLCFALVASASFSAAAVVAIGTDPYDTGRFALLPPRPTDEISPRFDMASRGRDPSFDAVIIGNSHIAPISPSRLSGLTGMRIASLTAPGSSFGPQLTMLRWFLSHRQGPARAIILGVDEFWCRDAPERGRAVPFPAFLFARGWLDYVAGMLNFQTVEQGVNRLVRPRRHARARPADGFWDFEVDLVWEAARVARVLKEGGIAFTYLRGVYPALQQLANVLEAPSVTPATRLVLVRPPVWAEALPAPGTPQAQSEAACRQAVEDWARGRPNTTVIDWRNDRPENRDMTLFFDAGHYRPPIALKIEGEIAETLR